MFRPALALTMTNVQTVLDAGLRAIAGGQTSIDLAEVTTVDSTAVVILLAWRRAAGLGGKPLDFRNIPANLQSLMTLYGVDSLLQPAASRTDLPHH